MTIRVLIADDHPLFRSALSGIVYSVISDCTIDEVDDYANTRTRLQDKQYTIAFIDLNMPDSSGLSDLALLKKLNPSLPIVVVSAHEDEDIIRSCVRHQASGYIIKSAPPGEIKNSIKRLLNGEQVFPEGIDLAGNGKTDLSERVATLTPSQLKVFIEVGKGKLNKQIAFDLDITEATVKAHITSVFKKLGIYNRAQAVLLAQQLQARTPVFAVND